METGTELSRGLFTIRKKEVIRNYISPRLFGLKMKDYFFTMAFMTTLENVLYPLGARVLAFYGNFLTAIPATEQLATFRGLFYDDDFHSGKRLSRESYLASLLEAAGRREEALRIWLTLRQGIPAGERSALGDRAAAAIKRLSQRR